MKRWFALALVGVLFAVMSCSFVRRGCCDRDLASAAACGDVACWFRCEFGVDDAVSAAIAAEQKVFNDKCRDQCAEVARLIRERAALPAGAPSSVITAADEALSAAKAARLRDREAFVARIEAMLPESVRARYRETVAPHMEVCVESRANERDSRR